MRIRSHRSAEPPTSRQEPAFWIFDLTASERATLIATFGGWALDGMDVMIYSFVIPTLIAQWHMSQGQAGMLSTAALLISAVGGWLAGLAGRPLRPRSRSADHHLVVRRLHLS